MKFSVPCTLAITNYTVLELLCILVAISCNPAGADYPGVFPQWRLIDGDREAWICAETTVVYYGRTGCLPADRDRRSSELKLLVQTPNRVASCIRHHAAWYDSPGRYVRLHGGKGHQGAETRMPYFSWRCGGNFPTDGPEGIPYCIASYTRYEIVWD